MTTSSQQPIQPTPRRDRRNRSRKETQVRIRRADHQVLKKCLEIQRVLGYRRVSNSNLLHSLLFREFQRLAKLAGSKYKPTSSPPSSQVCYGYIPVRERY